MNSLPESCRGGIKDFWRNICSSSHKCTCFIIYMEKWVQSKSKCAWTRLSFFFFWQWYEPDAAFGRTVIRLSTIGFTLPKSAILICPSEVSSKFSGCQENVNYFLFFMSTIIEQTSIRNLDITVYQSHVVYVFEGIDHFCSIKPSFILWQTTFLLINYSRFRMKKTKM